MGRLRRPPARTTSGYRVYAQSDVHALSIIKHTRNLGFSIEETRALIEPWHDKNQASAEAKALALRHVRNCHGDTRPECPMLNDLSARGKT